MGCQQGKPREAYLPRNSRKLVREQQVASIPKYPPTKFQKPLVQPVNPPPLSDGHRSEQRRKTDQPSYQPTEYWVYNPNIEKKLKVPKLTSADESKLWQLRGSQRQITIKFNSMTQIHDQQTQ